MSLFDFVLREARVLYYYFSMFCTYFKFQLKYEHLSKWFKTTNSLTFHRLHLICKRLTPQTVLWIPVQVLQSNTHLHERKASPILQLHAMSTLFIDVLWAPSALL